MSSTKTCRGCSQEQPLSSFYAHFRIADGFLNYCKTCVKLRVAHQQRSSPDVKERAERRYRSSARAQEQLRDMARRHFADPVKRKATRATSNAIARGKLVRPNNCWICQRTGTPEAHHVDYARPLDVVWLCRSCHIRVHAGSLSLISLPF